MKRIKFDAVVTFDSSGVVYIAPQVFDAKTAKKLQAARDWFKGKPLKICKTSRYTKTGGLPKRNEIEELVQGKRFKKLPGRCRVRNRIQGRGALKLVKNVAQMLHKSCTKSND